MRNVYKNWFIDVGKIALAVFIGGSASIVAFVVIAIAIVS